MFPREEMLLLNLDDVSIITLNDPKGVPLSNISFVQPYDVSIVSDHASVNDSYNLDEPNPHHLCQ